MQTKMSEQIIQKKYDCGKMRCPKCQDFTPHQSLQTEYRNVFICAVCGYTFSVNMSWQAQAQIRKQMERKEIQTYGYWDSEDGNNNV